MRIVCIIAAIVLSACSQAAPGDVPEDASAGSSGAGRVSEVAFTLESEALVGLWSFDRTCALYDLVFRADGVIDYYDYSVEGSVVSYRGAWATVENNRVMLTVQQVDPSNTPTGDAMAYNLDVASPVTDDLIGDFAREGAEARAITARRCPEEDRD